MNSNTNMNKNSWNCASNNNSDAYLIGSVSNSNNSSNMVPTLSPYDGYASDAYFSSSPPPAHKSQAGMLTTPPTYWSCSSRQEDCLSACSSSLTNTPELESQTFAAADSQKMMYGITTPAVDPMLFATTTVTTSNGSFTNQAIYPQQQLMVPLIQHETQPNSQKLLSHFYQQPSFITHATVGGAADISYALHPATSYYPSPIMSNATTTTTFEGGSNTINRYSTYPYQQQQQQQHGFYNNSNQQHHHRSPSSSSSSLYSSSPLMRTTITNSTSSSKTSTPSYGCNTYEHQLNFNHNKNHCNNYSSASQAASSSLSVKYEQQENNFPQQQRINNHHVTSSNNNNRQSNSNNIFPCSVPNCNKLFSRPYNLKSHMRTHTHERPFECKYKPCGWKFARPHDLKRHELQHTGQKPHGCNFCPRRFARSDALKRHWKVDATCAQALKQDLLLGKESSIVNKKKRSTTKKQQ